MVALDQDEDQEGATILKLLLLTGARSAEMLKMEWSQLDLDGGVSAEAPHRDQAGGGAYRAAR